MKTVCLPCHFYGILQEELLNWEGLAGDVDDCTVKEIAGEELSIECSTHEEDFQVRTERKNVSQDHHQEVTAGREHD